jgi:ribonuclease III
MRREEYGAMDDREDREAGSQLRRKNEAVSTRVSNPSPLERIVGYEFRDRSLLAQAITHASYVNDKKSLEKSENEKLEFLGDAVLNSVVSILLFKKYTDKDEGFLSNARSCLVKRDMLTEVARTIRLDEYMSYGNGKTNLPSDSKVLSNMLEALIGAVYLDGGFRVVSRVVKSLFGPYFLEEKLKEKNPKNVLQEYSQKKWGVLPKYRLTRKGKEGFSIYVYVGKELKAKGMGKSKREAEQRAATLLLKQIETL